jgi:CheY-like chemotaxis protein
MENGSFKGIEILIVEDNPMNYYILKELINLIGNGAVCFWAKNGLEALDILTKQENISLILMDINMPEMDGITATRKIREKKIDIPIIFQTAYASEKNKQECFKAGGNDFLSKPLGADKLSSAIKKYLVKT